MESSLNTPDVAVETAGEVDSDFIRFVIRNIEGRQSTLHLLVEITRRCNFHCLHCNVVQRPETVTLPEASKDKLLSQISRYEDQAVFLTLTGGEPLIRADFNEIWGSLWDRKRFVMGLSTNLSALDTSALELLEAKPPHTIDVTLYSWSNKVFEQISGNDRYDYRTVYRNIDRVRARVRTNVRARIPIMKQNIHEVRTIKQYCMEHRIPFSFLWVYYPPNSTMPLKHFLPPKRQMLRMVSELVYGKMKITDAVDTELKAIAATDLRQHSCAKNHQVCINPAAASYRCMLSPDGLTPRTESHQSRRRAKGGTGRRWGDTTRCRSCAARVLCSLCDIKFRALPSSTLRYYCWIFKRLYSANRSRAHG